MAAYQIIYLRWILIEYYTIENRSEVLFSFLHQLIVVDGNSSVNSGLLGNSEAVYGGEMLLFATIFASLNNAMIYRIPFDTADIMKHFSYFSRC